MRPVTLMITMYLALYLDRYNNINDLADIAEVGYLQIYYYNLAFSIPHNQLQQIRSHTVFELV